MEERLGIIGLEPPPGTDPEKALEYLIDEAAKLEVQVVGGDHRALFQWGTFAIDLGYWDHLRSMAAGRGLEIEPHVRSPFDLTETGAEGRAATVDSIRAAKHLGGPIMRTAYGRNSVATSRYASTSLHDHLSLVTASLRLAAELADSEGVVLAIENHCDFSGREWAEVLEEVDSPSVRAALDTGNGMAVFCDPMDDAEALAPWTVTTHIKDITVFDGEPLQPFRMIGCAIGEGSIDLRQVLGMLVDRSPGGRATPLIVEPSWPPFKDGDDRRLVRREMGLASLRNLRRMLAELPGEVVHEA